VQIDKKDAALMSQKEIVIIGASRGLGLGLVREYLSRGWRVTATARDLGRADALRALASTSPDLRLETVDIDDGAAAAALAQRLHGIIFDVVFINAGVSGPKAQGADQATRAEVGALFYTNAIAPIRIAEKLVGLVKPGTGVVAFMSSRVGSLTEESSGFRPLYRASKAALNSMTKSFVASLKNNPVTVLSMHPGWVRTDMGGPDAPLDVATSVAGLADVVDKRAGTKVHAFVDYQDTQLPW
jgi:NAD(P)-dependent dehydrogenase (short-subunit alcohol dehydrogenase family)